MQPAHRGSASASDLPYTAVAQIVRRALSRCIAGTNRFAAVCHQWREASNNDDSEPLQLFMDLRFISEADQARARSWMSTYGQLHVEELVIAADTLQAQPSNWFPQAAPSLTRLKRLDVKQEHSLVHLAPVLGQLPQLQHLAVGVALTLDTPPIAAAEGFDASMFVDHLNQPLGEVPNLHQLCPKLVHLRLELHPDDGGLAVDARLPRLLPHGLQQLTLSAENKNSPMELRPASLMHLTALQQLQLKHVKVAAEGREALVQQLRALPKLSVSYMAAGWSWDGFVSELADMVAAYRACDVLRMDVAPQLTCLTKLCLTVNRFFAFADAVPPMSMLTRLQDLYVGDTLGYALPDVMQQAAGMSQLRVLRIVGHAPCASELSSSLARCTQLNTLMLDVRGSNGEHVTASPQLTGLKSLSVMAHLQLQGGSAWLAPYTGLTQLAFMVPYREDGVLPCVGCDGEASVESQQQGMAQAVLQQIQEWPAGLQTVRFWVVDTPWTSVRAPMRWHHDLAGGKQVTAWLDTINSPSATTHGLMRPCPHLPGVWEVL